MMVTSSGWSFWLTPRSKIGWEALVRYDHLTPDTRFDTQVRKRTILGVAYWFRETGSVRANSRSKAIHSIAA